MLQSIAYYQVLGFPLIMYGGITTLLCLMVTATIGHLNVKGNTKIPMKWHFRMARITILIAVLHGVLGISLFIK